MKKIALILVLAVLLSLFLGGCIDGGGVAGECGLAGCGSTLTQPEFQKTVGDITANTCSGIEANVNCE